MKRNKNYAGIDCARLVFAFLIIAIHTSPLSIAGGTADFVLSGVIARTGVPFFFMVTGFFLISRYTCNNEKLYAFIKKTILIYAVAILIYIPVNIYNGYFTMDNLLPEIIKDIVFDGTLYHLWYLPASLSGAVIAWYLVKKLDFTKALIIAAFLYIVGLSGDSYYGIIENIPVIKGFYNLVFQITDYTRNGIFFAPVFLILGGYIAENRSKFMLGINICGFAVSFVLMLAEALVLHNFNIQRHNSMYIFLLPVMYFLFNSILFYKGRRFVNLRTLSLLIYIIHPMVIVVIRMCAKLLHIQEILTRNSLVYYLATCIVSLISSAAVLYIWNRYKTPVTKHRKETERAYIEINLSNLEYNARALQKLLPGGCRLMAVVKAEAYGHGSQGIAIHLERAGLNSFATATIDEAVKLRKCGIRGEILILGYTDARRAHELKKYRLIQTITDWGYAKELNRQGTCVQAHIKIDTGMHRLGITANNTEEVISVFNMKNINVCGMYTHLCCADSLEPEDILYTKEQINSFYRLAGILEEHGIKIPKLHIQSSYGILNYPGLKAGYARAGIALYGVYSSPGDKTVADPGLRPVLSIKSKVILIRELGKGESAGYGRAFVAGRDSRIAIVPAGYADGIPRSLSCGMGNVLINGQLAPIAGRICMDQLIADITDIENVKTGDIVTIIGTEESGTGAAEIACNSGSISNELLSRLGTRLPVVFS
ncbi:MAG: serine racemase VanT catalytic subunit [Lachnospiraceae bacterium]|nr:serine racemase VanT catalytic subunit [Lachnospiraceae bacterium]